QGVTAVVARRITGSMLREDRDGTSSLIEVEDRHPVVGDQSLELPRETLEEPARIELGRHRASPRRDGADDAPQVDLNFRHAAIIRPPRPRGDATGRVPAARPPAAGTHCSRSDLSAPAHAIT